MSHKKFRGDRSTERPQAEEYDEFIQQFDFSCKYNKYFNQWSDCSDYLGEIKETMTKELQKNKKK